MGHWHYRSPRDTSTCRKLRPRVDFYTVSKLLCLASIAMIKRCVHLSQGDLKAAVECKSMLQDGTPTATWQAAQSDTREHESN